MAQQRAAASSPERAPPVALLLGISSYPDLASPLKHPIKDAQRLADELKKRGFNVLPIGKDLTRDDMRAQLDELYAQIKPGSAALIYFSGFGIQSANSRSYLIPSNAQIWTEADVKTYGFDVQSILDEMNLRGAAVKVAIIDASRKNPWEWRFHGRSMGLAPVVGNKGSIVMYAAAPNTVVDDDEGENSLFMRDLLKEIQAPGLTVEEAFFRVRNEVSQATKTEQVPWVSSSLFSDVYINPPVGSAQQGRPDPCQGAEAHWKSAEEIKTKAVYTDHLQRFADCPFATLARARIEAIDQAAAAAEADAKAKAAADARAAADERAAAEAKAAQEARAAALAKADADAKAAADARATADARAAADAKAAADARAAAEARASAVAARAAADAEATRAAATCGISEPRGPQLAASGGPFVPVSIKPDLASAKEVRAIEFSPDGSKFATAGDDGMIRIFDASTFRLIQTLRGDPDPVYSISFWSDGSLLASAGATGMVRVWQLNTGRIVNTFRAGSDLTGRSLRQFGVAFAPDRSLQFVDSVGDDGRVFIWDVVQNNLRRVRQNMSLRAVDPTMRSISFAPDTSGEFVTASFDGAIRFYTSKSEPDTYQAYSGKALRVAYSPDGRYVVSAGVDRGLKNLKIWDAKTHAVLRNLDGHIDYVVSAAWSADGTRIVSGGGGKDKVVRVWDAMRGTQIQQLVGHHEDVEAVAFFPRKNWVVSVSEDKTLKVWDVARGRELLSLVAFTDGEYLAYTPLGCYAGSSGAEQHVKVVTGGVERGITSDTRRAFYLPGGVAPLLAAMDR